MNGDVPKFSLIKFKTLIRNLHGPAHATNEVLHTEEELDEYVASCQDKQKPTHAVRFPEERVIAVALGAQRPGGPTVEIIGVVQETGGFVGIQHHVLYVEQILHGHVQDRVTYPHHVVRVRGLSGVVSFRQVPDRIGHSLHALAGAITGAGQEPSSSTTLAVGEETPPTAHVGEHPTTLAWGEEGGLTTLAVGEETPPTGHVGEHPTTLAWGEEGHVTTLALGEETPGGSGSGGGRGPFG
ncbi:MAG TPA: hypothetical protein VHN14_06825 [Kofleriaceae bacterium]|jgi:hypothetical protein|nr:hypothetical protein [Kofleriaceae bacterium]